MKKIFLAHVPEGHVRKSVDEQPSVQGSAPVLLGISLWSFILFILISTFLFFSLIKVEALTPIPTNKPFNFTVPGYNCGYAEDPTKNQCCRVTFPSTFNAPDLGPMNILIKTFEFFTNAVRDNFLQPLIDTFTSIAKSNVSSCYTGVQSIPDANDPSCKCINPIAPSPGYLKAMNDFCQRQFKIEDRNACLACANDGGVFSGIGCVKTDSKKFIEETVFGLGIGLAGGFSLLCIIYAAFMMQSSQGNPEKLKKAQELITSCIMGLMLIIFSVFILKLIGVNILKIPGFD
jgi:hypothetical protein